jgi:hypothetical protein
MLPRRPRGRITPSFAAAKRPACPSLLDGVRICCGSRPETCPPTMAASKLGSVLLDASISREIVSSRAGSTVNLAMTCSVVSSATISLCNDPMRGPCPGSRGSKRRRANRARRRGETLPTRSKPVGLRNAGPRSEICSFAGVIGFAHPTGPRGGRERLGVEPHRLESQSLRGRPSRVQASHPRHHRRPAPVTQLAQTAPAGCREG